MRSTIVFLVMLYFVHSTTTESQLDLENNQAFVELSNQPISQAFFSAAALRMKEEGKGGFAKIMALMNELIHDNRKQLQNIRKINASTQSECTVVSHKLKDRSIFFQGQTRYFKRRGSVTLEEKTEAVNIRNSRNAQNVSYGNLLTAANARWSRKSKKWADRCANAQVALNKASSAIRVVNEWTPKKSAALVQTSIKEAVETYSTLKKIPLGTPDEMIQLAANDRKLRKRLFEWLNFLRAAVKNNLVWCQRAQRSVNIVHTNYRNTIARLRNALSHDSKKLSQAIENYTILYKVYQQNEKIYSALFDQNSLLVQSNNEYCKNERNGFAAGQKQMLAQLDTFIKLRYWLRKNFHRVKRWLRTKYSNVQ